MTNVKTAISLPESLFEKVDALAHDLQISRSRLFVLAVEDLIRRRENQQLLEAINAAYDDLPDEEEPILRRHMREKHKKLIDGQW
jgi:metal-responsive CopG/Arc/MetJ family transcriptional regulator